MILFTTVPSNSMLRGGPSRAASPPSAGVWGSRGVWLQGWGLGSVVSHGRGLPVFTLSCGLREHSLPGPSACCRGSWRGSRAPLPALPWPLAVTAQSSSSGTRSSRAEREDGVCWMLCPLPCSRLMAWKHL